MIMREAEAQEKKGEDMMAKSKYEEAQRLFRYIARTHPSWKTEMMQYRQRVMMDKIEEIRGRLKTSNLGPLPKRPDRSGLQPGPGGGESIVIVPGKGELAPQTPPRSTSGHAASSDARQSRPEPDDRYRVPHKTRAD